MAMCNPQPHSFDKMAKALTSAVSRRDAFKYVGAGVLGTMLVSVGVREAHAARCVPGGACTGQVACPPKHGGQCGCTHKVRKNGTLSIKGFCWQNQFCAGLISCAGFADCQSLGKNWKCADSCCGGFPGGGKCLPKCGSVPDCCSAQGGGLTARG